MNQLKVNQQQTIVALHQQGWSKRKLARELGLDRVTVRKYLAAAAANSPTPQTGSDAAPSTKSPANPQPGSAPGPRSQCEPGRAQIQAAWQAGLSVQRIYQDLVTEHQFAGSYHVVRRFVVRVHDQNELPFRRMECAPGQELQVDFGRGAWVVEEGRRRRPHVFRCVLSHSRKGYSEAHRPR